jgi:predicted acylesterase/phospholipase RssA
MFFWQLGVLQYLEQMYDLSEVTMVGSSAGSMLSVFAACDVQGQVRCSASVHS